MKSLQTPTPLNAPPETLGTRNRTRSRALPERGPLPRIGMLPLLHLPLLQSRILLKNQGYFKTKAASRRMADPGEEIIRIFIADDHEDMRRTLIEILSACPGLVVVGEAADGEETVKEVTRLEPQVVLMDVSMPLMDGVAATRAISETPLDVHIIALSMYDESEKVNAMFEAGAESYFTKTTSVALLINKMRALLS